jgi:hypothetical protein
MSMPPEPVTGFCILPRVATMSRTAARSAAPSTLAIRRAVDLGQLPIGGGIEVEGLDVDAYLVRPDLRRDVEALSGLWQRDLLTRWLEDPVQTHRRALGAVRPARSLNPPVVSPE